MLEDFKSMVNWLISYGLWAGRPKNPDRDEYWAKTRNRVRFDRYRLCADTTDWFEKNWHPKYAAHYHEAACSFAAQQMASWLALGGDTSSPPYLKSPQMRLRKDLFKAVLQGDRFDVRVVTDGRRSFLEFSAMVHHGLLNTYAAIGSIGEMTLHEDYLDLVFATPDERPKARMNAGMDTNLKSIDIALDDRVEHVSLEKVAEIQRRHREGRKQIQRAIPRNLQKQRKLLRRRSRREHERVEQVIRKEVVPEILAKTEGYNIAWDDLATTTEECIYDSEGRRFHERLSSWVHGRIQDIADDKSKNQPLPRVFTRGTSTYCPFDGSLLKHPDWKISVCSECGRTYDRDSLSAVSTKVRSMYRHRKGDPWKRADEVLPKEQVRMLSEASLYGSLGERAVRDPTTEKRGYGAFPLRSGGFDLNAASSAGLGAASLTRGGSDLESLREVGQNGCTAPTTPARTEEEVCPRRTT